MFRTLIAAAFGVAFLGASAASAYAESPPEPYSAPDPVYTYHQDHASATVDSDGHIVAPGSLHHAEGSK